MRHRVATSLVLAGALAAAFPAQGHRILLFATRENDVIRGYAYLPGGQRVSGADIRVQSENGPCIAQLATGDDGTFSFEPEKSGVYVFILETADGHRATWEVDYRSDPGTGTSSVSRAKTGVHDGKSAGRVHEPEANAPCPIRPPAVERIVEKAVRNAVGPLQRQLAEHDAAIRFRDIAGGIGYIVGIMGVVMLLKSSGKRRDCAAPGAGSRRPSVTPTAANPDNTGADRE